MSFLGLTMLGLICLWQLPVSLLPKVAIPVISVHVKYPDCSARNLEDKIMKPLRNQFRQVQHLEDQYSQTQDGSAVIELIFRYGTAIDLAFLEVNEKMDQILGSLPKDLERPNVIKAQLSDIPVFHLSVQPKAAKQLSMLELSQFGQKILKRRIEQLNTVALADISGLQQAQLLIQPKSDAFENLQLDAQYLENLLRQNNLNAGNMILRDGQYQYTVQLNSRIRSKTELEDIYLKYENRLLQIKDIATVTLDPARAAGAYLYNGREAIIFSIRKKANAQLYELRSEFKTLLKDLEQTYPNLIFRINHDQSELLDVSIKSLGTSLLFGLIAAVLVVFLFFRNLFFPALIAFSIPVSLAITFLGFYLLQISINIIALSGLILGIGLMIDNAIIIIENIRQKITKNESIAQACVSGAKEVIRPLISSALTTCSVFLPLISLSGKGGALFFDQAMSIAIALMASLIVAYYLLPVMIYQYHKQYHKHYQTHFSTGATRLHQFHNRSLSFLLHHRKSLLLLFCMLAVAAIFPVQHLDRQAFPEMQREGIRVDIDWNEPLALVENKRRIQSLLDQLNCESNTFLGQQQFKLNDQNQGLQEATLWLYPKAIEHTTRAIRTFFQAQYPNTVFSIRPERNLFDEVFSSGSPPLSLALKNTNSIQTPGFEEIKSIISFLQSQQIPHQLPALQEQFLIKIKTKSALLYDVDVHQIKEKLKSIFHSHQIGKINNAGDYLPILVDQSQKNLQDVLAKAWVKNQYQEKVHLANLIQIRKTLGYKNITADNNGEKLAIDLDSYQAEWLDHIRTIVQNQKGLQVNFTGSYFANEQQIKELSYILLLSLVLLYLILTAQFESLWQPFIVVLTVPVSLSAALYTLWVFGQSLNMIAVIGMIAMSGIVVNDAILKVDMINKLQQRLTLPQALQEAGLRRLKPILMTSLTTILALLPVLFANGLGADLQQPLALSIIAGLAMGTIASIYLIPLLYLLFQPQ
jgi:multidrug efflux pump subunit AcrB